MKKFIAFLSFVIIISTAFAQNQGTPHMFTGKLIAAPNNVPHCGSLAVAAVYEFEIAFFSDDSYTETTIAIVFDCPELLGTDFFKVGSSYKMEVFDGSTTNYSIFNAGILDNYNLTHNYYAGDIKRL